jgi:integrase
MLSGHLQEKGGKYYAVLNCKHHDGSRFPKWISTDLPVKKGNKVPAKKKLEEYRGTYDIYGELIADAAAMTDSSVLSVPSNVFATLVSETQAIGLDQTQFSDDGVLFADYMLTWLSYMETEVDPVTYAGYYNSVVEVIVPYFRKKGVKLHELTATDLKDFYRYERLGDQETQKGPKKGTTVVRYHANIHTALEVATADNLVTRNVAHKMRPATDKFIGSFYLMDEAIDLMKVAKGTPLELAVMFGLFYGLRRSEIVGLKWQNFDLVNGTFTIAHTVTSYRLNGKTVRHAKDKTKNQSSLRSLPLIPIFIDMLTVLKAKQKEDRLVFAEYYSQKYQDYVYVNDIGQLMSPNYISSAFPKLLRKHGLRHIRFHDTRHSCASLLLKNGVSMKEIQAWLGHSDYGTTANLYAHLDVDNSKLASAQRLSAGLFGPSEPIAPEPDPQPPTPDSPSVANDGYETLRFVPTLVMGGRAI